jgi:hypothetical protein
VGMGKEGGGDAPGVQQFSGSLALLGVHGDLS